MPGWKPLIVCSGEDCHFDDVMTLVQNVIHDLVLLSTLLVVVVLIVAGVKLLASRGNPSALTAAKDMMGKVILGYIVILIAWVAVYSITSAVIDSDFLPKFK